MKSFKDFEITIEQKSFVGDKIKIDKVLNREITVHEFKIVDSKFGGKRLDMQIAIGEEKRVLWTASQALMEQIQKVPAEGFPFRTKIVKENERFEFT